MKKMFLKMVLTVVLGLFVAGFVTAATGGMGWMLPTGTPPHDTEENIGLSEVELAALAAGEGMEEKPPLTEQQKAIISQEIQAHNKIVEEGVFYKEKDESGREYWPGSAYGGLESVLASTIHKWVAVRFTGDDSVRVFLMPPSDDIDIKELRKDLIKAAKIAFQRVPELERIEFDLSDIKEEQKKVFYLHAFCLRHTWGDRHGDGSKAPG
ncbi:hypothetical protein SY88_21240 [Clostridiales bacterium PH28_bin88]|nr:hypothetical protein SY88_21240 [Clostridiales bacterium PH28_bin88]